MTTYSLKVSLVKPERRKPCQPLVDMRWRFCIEDPRCIFRFIQLESKDSLGETRLHIQSTKTVQKKKKKKGEKRERGIKYTCMKPP